MTGAGSGYAVPIGFLLTRPLRDVTALVQGLIGSVEFLLTRPLRDVTTFKYQAPCLLRFLLTRPLRDVTPWEYLTSGSLVFLLTRPLRDVTIAVHTVIIGVEISTHTPLAGRDQNLDYVQNDIDDFYSHAPCGT